MSQIVDVNSDVTTFSVTPIEHNSVRPEVTQVAQAVRPMRMVATPGDPDGQHFNPRPSPTHSS